MNISDRLKEQMKIRKISVPGLSEKTGISENTIKNYLYRGQEPRAEAMLAIANALDISAAYLRGESDDPTRPIWESSSTLDELKERGVWLFGAEADGTVGLYDAPFDRPTAIIIGSEGQGLSRLTRDKCDYIVSIPMRGRVNSLNASNAAAVLLFEALRRRTQGN